MSQVYIFYKKNNEITNKKVVRQAFDALKDGRYKMELSPANRRSTSQNAYFHSVVLDFVRQGLQDAGYADVKTNEDAKTVVKALFLKDHIVHKVTGEVLTTYIKDTATLTTLEFMTFIDEIVRWSSEYLCVVIPAPGQSVEMF